MAGDSSGSNWCVIMQCSLVVLCIFLAWVVQPEVMNSVQGAPTFVAERPLDGRPIPKNANSDVFIV